jgi:hypothetical protein
MKTMFAVFFLSLLAVTAVAQGPAYPYSVTLSFTASTGTVTGYNMYRAPYTTSCGAFTKLNTTPFTATSYTDNNPAQAGYCYAATSLDGTLESGLSNVVSNIQIPPPPPTGLGATVATVHGVTTEQFTWVQSKGTVNTNQLYCRPAPTGTFTDVLNTSKPAVGVSLTTFTKGTHYCVVTATGPHGQSGPSNQVALTVN